jgi:hypothetical protein
MRSSGFDKAGGLARMQLTATAVSEASARLCDLVKKSSDDERLYQIDSQVRRQTLPISCAFAGD